MSPVDRAGAAVAIDWGTTNRRGWLFAADGTVLAEAADAHGMVASRGRFPQRARELLATLGAPDGVPVVMAGMVGAAQGWHEAPYLPTTVPLTDLPQHLLALPPLDGHPLAIVPGYCDRGDGRVDVMRGEDTQLLGAVVQGHRDGVFVMPGTHSKWVRVRDARIDSFRTFMTGELFELLGSRGTLAAAGQGAPAPQAGAEGGGGIAPAGSAGAMSDAVRADAAQVGASAAFDDGVRSAARAPLSQALFECRARVVTGTMPATDTAARVSGVLIGAEFAAWRAPAPAGAAAPAGPLLLIGAPALVQRYRHAARVHGLDVLALDARALFLAAARHLCRLPQPA